MWRGRTSPRAELSALAVQTQLDAFTKVKEAIDNMIGELKAQMAEEVKHKDFCTSELNQNEKTTFKKTKLKEDLEAKIEDLAATIETLTSEIEAAKGQISAARVEVKRASEAREKENAEFQQTVADQRATQAILNKAKARMEAFYKKKVVGCRLRQFSSNRTTYCPSQSILVGRCPVLTSGTGSARDSEHFEG